MGLDWIGWIVKTRCYLRGPEWALNTGLEQELLGLWGFELESRILIIVSSNPENPLCRSC